MRLPCETCKFNENGYCKNPKVMLADRDGYADFGVVSVCNYGHTNCCRVGPVGDAVYFEERKNA